MTAFLCDFRECGELEVSSRWSNGRFVVMSVLGGLEEGEGGGVVGGRENGVDGSEVRRLEFDRM